MKKKSKMQKQRRRDRHVAGKAKARESKKDPTPRPRWDVRINGHWVPYGLRYRKPKVGGHVASTGATIQNVREAKR